MLEQSLMGAPFGETYVEDEVAQLSSEYSDLQKQLKAVVVITSFQKQLVV